MALQDERLEYIKKQYDEKNAVLAEFGEQVNPFTFYEDIFSDLSMTVPVVIIDEEEEKKIQPMQIEDAISFASCRNDTLMGGCTYFNNWISKRSAKDIHAFIIDFDNAYSGIVQKALQDDWRSANGEPFAKPTYIVNSGTGLHLYFLLSEPIPCYQSILKNIDKLYRSLAVQQSCRVYIQKQVQWFGQDFRIAGGNGKYGWENTIFRVGEKWDIDELARAVDLQGVHFIRYGERRTEKPVPSKKRKQHRQGWRTNRTFYDYALKSCRDKTKEGNRYTSLCALSVIAWKCDVGKEELEKDLFSLLPIYNKGATRQVKEKEVHSAMKMYNDRAMLTQRESLEHWQGWEYKPVQKRFTGKKHMSRKDHWEKRVLPARELYYPDGEWRYKQPSAEQTVRAYIETHPQASKAEVIKSTGFSKPTVYKYWNKR